MPKKTENKTEHRLPVAEMYPELSPDRQAEAEHFLTRYFEVVEAIHVEKCGLTDPDLNATV